MAKSSREDRLNDLRGVAHRAVHRDDAVVISGGEYMKTGRRVRDAEARVVELEEQGRFLNESREHWRRLAEERDGRVVELTEAVRAWLKFDNDVEPPKDDAPYEEHVAYETAKFEITERAALAAAGEGETNKEEKS